MRVHVPPDALPGLVPHFGEHQAADLPPAQDSPCVKFFGGWAYIMAASSS